MAADVFAMLKEEVNPMIEGFSPDDPVTSHPVIGSIDREEVKGFQQPQAGKLDIYTYKSSPAVVVGDTIRYKQGSRGIDSGSIKFKFITQQVIISQEESRRMLQFGSASIVGGMVNDQLVKNHRYFINQVARWGVNRWEGVTTDAEYDSEFKSMFHTTAGGTISEPASLCGGTALDLSAINVSGTNQTANALSTILLNARKGLYKEDYFTHDRIPITNVTIYMHELALELLEGNTEVLNSTTGERAKISQANQLRAMGYTLVGTNWADSNYSGATTVTSEWIFVSNPGRNFKMLVSIAGEPGESSWSEWKERYVQGETLDSIIYETHRVVEYGFYVKAYFLWTSATASAFYKPVYHIKVTPFENS